jgi:hypothetical protein
MSASVSPAPRRIERCLALAVVAMALATVPLIILEEQGLSGIELDTADWVIWPVFAVDYIALFALAADRWA